jgi:hypothetical protein
MPRTYLVFLILLAPALFPLPLLSHEASLDGFGCHLIADQKAYQCHRGLLAGRVFDSKAEMLHTLEGSRPPRDEDNTNSAEVKLQSISKEPEQVCIRENFSKQILCGSPLR